jgi:hypothetical protein
MMPIALLAMLLVPPLSAEDDVATQLKKLQKAYDKSYQEIMSDYRAETDATKKRAIASSRMPVLAKEYMEKYQVIADAHAKTPDAVEALTLVSNLASRARDTAAATKAKQQLLANHINDKAFAKVVSLWSRDDETLAKIGSESTSRDVQGVALYYQMSKAKGRSLTDKNAAVVKPMMKRITDEFGDVRMQYSNGRDRGSLAELIENELFAFENLRIGKVAPDILGEDLDGVKFKLTDYRGKVVVIDFWGDW